MGTGAVGLGYQRLHKVHVFEITLNQVGLGAKIGCQIGQGLRLFGR